MTAAESTHWEEFVSLKKANPNTIMFWRRGGFYDLIGLDAFVANQIINFTIHVKHFSGATPLPKISGPLDARDSRFRQLYDAGFNVVFINDGVVIEHLVATNAVDIRALYYQDYLSYVKNEFQLVVKKDLRRREEKRVNQKTEKIKREAALHFDVEAAIIALDLFDISPKQLQDKVFEWKDLIIKGKTT